jgi:hypothetical protein
MLMILWERNMPLYYIMRKKDTTRCLDVVRFLPTVPFFPHTSCSKDFETMDLIATHNLS